MGCRWERSEVDGKEWTFWKSNKLFCLLLAYRVITQVGWSRVAEGWNGDTLYGVKNMLFYFLEIN